MGEKLPTVIVLTVHDRESIPHALETIHKALMKTGLVRMADSARLLDLEAMKKECDYDALYLDDCNRDDVNEVHTRYGFNDALRLMGACGSGNGGDRGQRSGECG